MDKEHIIASIADRCITGWSNEWVCVYGLRWKDTPTYIYVGMTKYPSLRLRSHKSSFCYEGKSGRFVKKTGIESDIEMDILIELKEYAYLVHEYEHRFSLEYLKRGYPLRIREFYTDKTEHMYNYLTLSLNHTHLKILMSQNNPWFKECSLSYIELYIAIRDLSKTQEIIIPEKI